ncbi:hypothetical protein BGW38_008234 [Lunasporangiospora selenospora]|uniref:Uncharacterized protein n=1 Tax=Lunasporangiospora selenospora TaxID=979761 RepID=A0A9P6KGD0_9FUNG|nr:hypothetical protein BGW38_008234 [Lunasporangiospora selenospora]
MARPHHTSGFSDVYPSPPSYEEALTSALQPPASAPSLPHDDGFSVGGFTGSDFAGEDCDDLTIDRDMDEERDYEESRPLKMGRIPDAKAQYTGYGSTTNDIKQKENARAGHEQEPSWTVVPPSIPEAEGSSSRAEPVPTATLQPIPVVPPPPIFAGVPSSPGLMNSQDISIAGYTRTKSGVESYDEVLQDPYQLYRFFVAHNDRPTMKVVITGHHMERRSANETDSNGNTKVTTNSVKVVDFEMEFDLTQYINPGGLLYVSSSKPGEPTTLKEVMEEHAEDENAFKELHLIKNIKWEYKDLTKAISHAIRSVRYHHTITVDYLTGNDRIIVRSSSPAAKFMRSNWTKAFCVVTCLGIVFYPARALIKRVRDKSLKSQFQMTISARDFYNSHYWAIVNQVQYV